MKHTLTTLLLFFFAAVAQAQQVRMMVMSDPHVFEKSLYDVPYGEAYIKAMQQDLKVSESSQALFEQFVGIALKEKPLILMIPGDLTKDGECVSHEYVASKLAEIKKNGTKVYVIPGNHDMENPLAYKFSGAKAEKVASVSEQEFRDIYKNFGYGEAVSMDSITGSYMAYPAPGLAVICLNTNIPNAYKGRYVHGHLFQHTLNWMERAAGMAHLEKRYIIAMSHHEIMQHHNQETTFAATAMLNQEKNVKNLPSLKAVQETFTRSGIQVVLTGHYHIQSINNVQTLYGTLTDISTGSISGFPSPFRRMTLNMANGSLSVTSATLFGNKPTAYPNTELSRLEMERLRYMVQIYVPRIGNQKTNMTDAYKYLATPFNKALCALAAGDETGHKPKQVYQECMDAFDKYVHHALKYNAIQINKVKTTPNGPYKKISELISSIMYNYVDNKKHVVKDNAITLKLKR